MAKSKVNNLQGLLSKSLQDDLEVLDQKTTLLTAPGEHYGSIMLALEVEIRRKSTNKPETLNLVAKLIPANKMLQLAFDIQVTFRKEVLAYMDAIPALQDLQKEYNVAPEKILDIFPKCYGARVTLDENKNEVDEDGVILFENLKLQGYKTDDRLIGLDLEAAKLIIRDLARFHAVPIALKRLKPDVFKEKVMPCLVKNKGLEQLPPEVGEAFHNSIMDGAKDIPELQQHLDRIQRLVDHAAANPYVNRPPPAENFATMVHSDYWTSNTMVLRDANGKALKTKMVDLQMLTYSSAIRDLIFFLFTSVVNKELDEHLDDFLKLYHSTFLDTLKDFNLDLSPYNWEAFEKELNDVAPTEVYHVLVMLKPICTERGKVQNSLEDFQDSDWSRKDLLGPNHRRKLKDTVLALVRKNWI